MLNSPVIITGSVGFIGFWLSRALLERGVKVLGVDCSQKALSPTLFQQRLEQLKQYPGFSFLEHDLAASELRINSDIKNAEIFIHLAARGGVRRSQDFPLEYIQNNIRAHQRVLSLCLKLPALRHFLYASSSSVYGDQKRHLLKESQAKGRTRSLYAMSKDINERLTYLASKKSNFICTGFRFFTVYGPLGRPDMAYSLFLDALKNKTKVTLWEGEALYRDFTYIEDVVNAVLAVIISEEDRRKCEILNVGSSEPRKVRDMLKILEQELQVEADIEYKARPETEILHTKADISRISNLTGWNPKFTLERGLARICNFDS